eukprot:CAMPEP_0194038258 /NCGR_PEP_ID=MMETSP0009_2-20130614/10511_1 /TAXON_ID=210454 /ORGANISM="Grammatophora oceanica, Strain CCMP 410" /LENGTH=188 /DNA_ID=CAMNT_0038680703 /DNA_START=73 /DNA_END=639 /DNA_ORIENTATION=+
MVSSSSSYDAIRNVNELPSSSANSTFDYHVKGVLLMAFATAFAQLGAFFECFFGIRGPNGKWPEAWWSFCFVAVAIVQFFNYLQTTPAKITIRDNSTISFFNYYGKCLYGGETELSVYEAFAIKSSSCWGVGLVLIRTDEHMANMKEQHKCCAGCIGKEYCLALRDIAKFRTDFGLDDDGGVPKTEGV